MSRRVPLNPFDRLLLASHLARRRRGLPGHPVLACVDVRGALDLGVLEAAARRALEGVPQTTARIGHSWMTGRAHWQLNGRLVESVPIEQHDLSARDDPEAVEHEMMLGVMHASQDPGRAPQVRLLCFRYEDDRHRIILCAPHYLTDLEGAQLFLSALGAPCDEGPGGAAHLDENGEAYPAEWSRRYVRRLAQGLRALRRLGRIPGTRFSGCPESRRSATAYLFRSWAGDAMSQITAEARRTCAAGPMLYTRFYLIALLRALNDLRGGPGIQEEEHYVVPMPVLLPRRGPRRMVAHNPLTIATLVIHRSLLMRPAELDAELAAQIRAYTESGLDEAMWMVMSYAGWSRKWFYEWLMQRACMFPRYSIGFASFLNDAWAEKFLGCTVENFYGWTLSPIPPGVMTSFCRFGSRLNMSLTYHSQVCPAELARQIVERTEHHLGVARTGSAQVGIAPPVETVVQ